MPDTLPFSADLNEWAVNAGFDVSSPSWDLFIAIFFVAAVVLYGLTLGRERIIVVLMSIYMGVAISHAVPVLANEGQILGFDAYIVRLVVFFAVILAMFFLSSRAGIFSGFGANGHILVLVAISVLQVGLLISTTLSYLPTTMTGALSPLMQSVFLSETAVTIWAVVPLLAFYFMKGKGGGAKDD
ncbi:MAG: hypothetical protein KC925_01225 [Candidatus Doudnabacteria bacterium]|nr:hypothetical protein [Candidatus Doudnabacteria bacterium]